MQDTKISWTNKSWNPTSGCSKISDGCKMCYAATLSERYGWTTKPWTIQNEAENVVLKPHKLHEPYKEKVDSRIFVNSMSDAFHGVIPDWYRAAIFCVMLDLPRHTFQVLTKRPELTIDWHERFLAAVRSAEFRDFVAQVRRKDVKAALLKAEQYDSPWAPHIWMGTSVEDARVLHRIDSLRQNKAQVRFISAEPLLGPFGPDVDFSGIHWVIVGGESGAHMVEAEKATNKRWMQQEWAREIKNACVEQEVAFFYKQDSGFRTEMRTYLVEQDGTRWKWEQYPGLHVPPVQLIDGQPVKALPEAGDPLALAQQAEYAAYTETGAQHFVDAHAFEAAYYYGQVAPVRKSAPTETPRHTITVYTGRIDSRDPDMLDITVKSASTPEGRALAPTWALVMKHKQGQISDQEYTDAYLALLRDRYTADPTPFLDILKRDRVVLTCYCPAGAFCHRHIAVDVLEKIAASEGIDLVRGGEEQRQAGQPAQMVLL